MSYFYHATSQKPTAVFQSVVGNFTGPSDTNLIIGKTTRLEIYLVSDDSVDLQYDFPISGRISSIDLVRLPNEKTDYVVITTEKLQISVISFDSQTNSVKTVAAGDLKDRVGRRCERGQIVSVDPKSRAIALQFYDAYLKIIPIGQSFEHEAFNVRIEEEDILDFAFLHRMSTPTLAVLVRSESHVSLRYYSLNLGKRSISLLHTVPYVRAPLSLESVRLLPVPAPTGGLLVLGGESVHYLDERVHHEKKFPYSRILTAYTLIDHKRALITDADGYLLLLAMSPESLSLTYLGSSVTSSTLSYLPKGRVFLGSSSADSVILRLLPQRSGPKDPFFVLESTISSLGPILDMALLEQGRHAPPLLVTASGVGHDGTLRLVRSGVGVSALAQLQAQGLRQVFALPAVAVGSDDSSLVVLCFPQETRLLKLASIEQALAVASAASESVSAGVELDIEEVELPLFEHASETLYVGQTLLTPSGGAAGSVLRALVQVLSDRVHVLALASAGQSSGEVRLTHQFDQPVVAAALVGADLFVALRGGELQRLRLSFPESLALTLGASTTLESEVSSLCGDSFFGSRGVSLGSEVQRFVCATLWYGEHAAVVLDAATLQAVLRVPLRAPLALAARSCALALINPNPLLQPTAELVDLTVSNITAAPPAELAVSLFLGQSDGSMCIVPLVLSVISTPSSSQMDVDMTQGTPATAQLQLAASSVAVPRCVRLGALPVQLSPLSHGRSSASVASAAASTGSSGELLLRQVQRISLLAACDRPALVSGRHGKVFSTPLNAAAMHSAAQITSVSSSGTEGDLLLVSCGSEGLELLSVDPVVGQTVRAVPLYGQPRRLARVQCLNGPGVAVALELPIGAPKVSPLGDNDNGMDELQGIEGVCVRVLDSAGEVLRGAVYPLDVNEECTCLRTLRVNVTNNFFPLSSTSPGATKDATADSGLKEEDDGMEELLVLGTALVLDEEEEPRQGRIVLLRLEKALVSEGFTLRVVASTNTAGAVLSLGALSRGEIIAGINNKATVYNFINSSLGDTRGISRPAPSTVRPQPLEPSSLSGRLQPTASCVGHSMSLYLSVRGDDVAVGDLIKSVSLLKYFRQVVNPSATLGAVQPVEGVLTTSLLELASDPTPSWITSLSFVPGSRNILAADRDRNLVLLRPAGVEPLSPADAFGFDLDAGTVHIPAGGQPAEGVDGEDSAGMPYILRRFGEFHCAEFCNAIMPGSLVSEDAFENSLGLLGSGSANAKVPLVHRNLLYAGIGGSIGALVAIPTQLFHYLHRVQTIAAAVLPAVGGLSAVSFRQFTTSSFTGSNSGFGGVGGGFNHAFSLNPEGSVPPSGFIDGDLLEQLLDAPKRVIDAVIDNLNYTRHTVTSQSQQGSDPFAHVVAPRHPDGSVGERATAEELLQTIAELAKLH